MSDSNSILCCKRNFKRISEQCVTGLSYKIETPISFRVTLPGGFVDHESFDARGHLNPWSIMRVEELARGFSFCMPTTDNEERVHQEGLVC